MKVSKQVLNIVKERTFCLELGVCDIRIEARGQLRGVVFSG